MQHILSPGCTVSFLIVPMSVHGQRNVRANRMMICATAQLKSSAHCSRHARRPHALLPSPELIAAHWQWPPVFPALPAPSHPEHTKHRNSTLQTARCNLKIYRMDPYV